MARRKVHRLQVAVVAKVLLLLAIAIPNLHASALLHITSIDALIFVNSRRNPVSAPDEIPFLTLVTVALPDQNAVAIRGVTVIQIETKQLVAFEGYGANPIVIPAAGVVQGVHVSISIDNLRQEKKKWSRTSPHQHVNNQSLKMHRTNWALILS